MDAEKLLVLYFGLAVVVSFLCSLLEAVILSVTPAYIEALEQDGQASGKVLKGLKDRINRPLAAILTLNTVANTVGAAGVGAQAMKLWGNVYMAVASGVLTLTILIFSEIVPKTLGAVFWRKLGPVAGYMITGLTLLLKPVVAVLEGLSRLLTPKGENVKLSREEMLATAEIGKEHGTLLTHETRIIHNLLGLQNVRAKDILTPRSVLLAWQKDMTVGEAVQTNNPIRFSRIPVYGKDMDDITGVVHRYRVLQEYSRGRTSVSLDGLSRPIHAVPETKSIASILEEFTRRREHIFLVVDEYGGTVGIVTLEDAIETLLGVEIVDEYDSVEDMRSLALQLWERRRQAHEDTRDS